MFFFCLAIHQINSSHKFRQDVMLGKIGKNNLHEIRSWSEFCLLNKEPSCNKIISYPFGKVMLLHGMGGEH